jgi:hypothetical protein
MHAIYVHHGLLYMQLRKGTMTTSVKRTVVLEVSSLAACRNSCKCVCVSHGGHVVVMGVLGRGARGGG